MCLLHVEICRLGRAGTGTCQSDEASLSTWTRKLPSSDLDVGLHAVTRCFGSRLQSVVVGISVPSEPLTIRDGRSNAKYICTFASHDLLQGGWPDRQMRRNNPSMAAVSFHSRHFGLSTTRKPLP